MDTSIIPELQLNHQIINQDDQRIDYDKENVSDQERESISYASSEHGYSTDFGEDFDDFETSEPEKLEKKGEDIVEKIIDAFTVKK